MNEQVVRAKCQILREQVFRPGTGLLAIGSRHARIGSEDGWGNPRYRRNKGPALRRREEADGRISIGYLLECLLTVFFYGSCQIGESVAVEQNSIPRTKNPFRRRTPSDTNSWADVIRILVEPSRQMLEIVT